MVRRWIPQPGDVVSASRGAYAHVGIVSDVTASGMPAVISSSKQLGRVVEETWVQFAGGSPVCYAGYPSGLPRHVVVARAKAQLGRRWALFDNCEHVASRAHGLRPHSGQLVVLGLLAAAIWAGQRAS